MYKFYKKLEVECGEKVWHLWYISIEKENTNEKKYSEEMKEETALYILESGKSITKAAKKLGLNINTASLIKVILNTGEY